MTLVRLAIGWLLVSVWFLAWEQVENRTVGPWDRGTVGPTHHPTVPPSHWFRAPLWTYLADALLLTLFASLWFASLGNGGWVLLFLVLGLLVEGPGRFRGLARGMKLSGSALVSYVLGVARILGAGALLWWRL